MKLDVNQPLQLDTDRHAQSRLYLAGGSSRGMYQKALAAWASDVLTTTPPIVWTQPDAFADFHCGDWRQLYAGSILDD